MERREKGYKSIPWRANGSRISVQVVHHTAVKKKRRIDFDVGFGKHVVKRVAARDGFARMWSR